MKICASSHPLFSTTTERPQPDFRQHRSTVEQNRITITNLQLAHKLRADKQFWQPLKPRGARDSGLEEKVISFFTKPNLCFVSKECAACDKSINSVHSCLRHASWITRAISHCNPNQTQTPKPRTAASRWIVASCQGHSPNSWAPNQSQLSTISSSKLRKQQLCPRRLWLRQMDNKGHNPNSWSFPKTTHSLKNWEL